MMKLFEIRHCFLSQTPLDCCGHLFIWKVAFNTVC